MTSSLKTRKTVSILTAVLFLLTGISGLLIMVSHSVRGQGVSQTFIISKHIHEPAAILFLLITVIHICYNGKTLFRYLGKS